MKTTIRFILVLTLILLSGFTTILTGQIKVFDNGNVGIKYTTSTPLSQLSFNSPGVSHFDVYFYSGPRSTNGGCFASVIETSISASAHIFGIVGEIRLGANNYQYGVKGSAWNATPTTVGWAYGLYGIAGNASSGYNFGVYGYLYGTNNGAAVYGTTSGDMVIPGKYAGYFRGDVYVTGGISCNTIDIRSSDKELKSNIELLGSTDGFDKINSLKPKTYSIKQKEIITSDSAKVDLLYNIDSELFKKRKYGFIAQELMEVFPDLVYTMQDGTLGIDYIGLIPVIVQTLQVQQRKLDDLEIVLSDLKKTVEAQQKRIDELEP